MAGNPATIICKTLDSISQTLSGEFTFSGRGLEALSRHSRQQLAGIHLAFHSSALTKFGMGKDRSPITNVGDDRRSFFHEGEQVLSQIDLTVSEK